jgi:hypothetical protein
MRAITKLLSEAGPDVAARERGYGVVLEHAGGKP